MAGASRLGCRGHSVKILDSATGEEKRVLAGHRTDIAALAFSPGGRRLVSADRDGVVKVWDASTGLEKRSWRGGAENPPAVSFLSFSPDGRLVILGSWLGLEAWDTASGNLRFSVRNWPDKVLGWASLRDGPRLVTAKENGSLRVVNPAVDLARLTLQDIFLRRVHSVTISPDGRAHCRGRHPERGDGVGRRHG